MISKVTKIKDTKKLVDSLPTVRYVEPDFIYIAMGNARCPSAELYIKEGEHVDSCQLIGMRHASFFDQPIHATCSGTFVGLEKHYHRNGKFTDFIKIKNDHLNTLDSSLHVRSDEEIAALNEKVDLVNDFIQIVDENDKIINAIGEDISKFESDLSDKADQNSILKDEIVFLKNNLKEKNSQIDYLNEEIQVLKEIIEEKDKTIGYLKGDD